MAQSEEPAMVCRMTNYKIAVAGFAYLWTLMLVGFMGVGLSIGGHLYQTSIQREKEMQLLFIGRQFRLAIERYKSSGPENAKDQYPASLDDLLKDPRYPNTVRHLRKLYIDPMTGKNEWGTLVLQGRIVGVHEETLRNHLRHADILVCGTATSQERKDDKVKHAAGKA